jgi:dimethylsulfide dehydrogenase subunit alpha/complex iron-sulfur molybdoenzyme family reductase subunit alpha
MANSRNLVSPLSKTITQSRREFLRRLLASSTLLTLNYSAVAFPATTSSSNKNYRKFEDIYREKWQWDRVVRGTHGTNCAGNCAFNVYVKNGIVWREEQQGEYGSSGDAPDYGPRGCQKGLRHAKYMYGPQRVLYPMKSIGERGDGKWERISWEQATTEIADKFLDLVVKYGPECISYGSGTQMALKRGSFCGLARFANITGVTVPEFLSGVGDLPSGVHLTLGQIHTSDTMAAVYKSRCVLVWMCNPAVTRLPDAHFFWDAKYNGTEVIAISPEFTPTAMHSSLWVNPKPGTDTALAMAMVQVILEESLYRADYIKEQSDLPLLVRTDNNRFLRAGDLAVNNGASDDKDSFFVWDEVTNSVVMAPGSGAGNGSPATLKLGEIRPMLEGTWRVDGIEGDVEVTTVFELLKLRAAEHSPESMSEITGVSPNVIRKVARAFAAAEPAMIFAGYAACKWLHGDILQRSMLLLLSLTGNIGPEGGGLQIGNSAKTQTMAFAFDGIGPAFRGISGTTWDYDHGDMKGLNQATYGEELAQEFDQHYQESIRRGWFPSYSEKGWKMGFFAGNGGANWRASGKRWRKRAFEELEMIVALVPDAGVTSHYADYVLPIAHHYERADMMLQSRTPYVQVLDVAVPPLGECVDDWEANRRLAEAISHRAKERGIGVIQDNINGRQVQRDYTRCLELFTMDGRIKNVKDVCQYIIDTTPGIPKVSFAELAARGAIRVDGSEKTTWDNKDTTYHSEIFDSVRDKVPYQTLTGRQTFYIDHEWFLKFDEALPAHKQPLANKGYPLRMMMGHARHGIHSMWRDDSFLLSLQRGEPDIYINPDDAAQRGVKDGDIVRVFNDAGEFFVMAHLSAGIQPSMLFMYHGWDPMMFRKRQNFGAVISTAGLIKPTSMAGGYGHIGYRPLKFSPNQIYKDFTCEFEKAPDDITADKLT